MATGMGPLGPRAALARPTADFDTYQGMQTWFKDCSAPGASDGTVPTASWFNHMIGQYVFAAAKAGVSLGNNQNNDAHLYNIIMALIAQQLGGGGGGSPPPSPGSGSWTLI